MPEQKYIGSYVSPFDIQHPGNPYNCVNMEDYRVEYTPKFDLSDETLLLEHLQGLSVMSSWNIIRCDIEDGKIILLLRHDRHPYLTIPMENIIYAYTGE